MALRLLVALTVAAALGGAPATAHAGLLPSLDLGLLDPLLGPVSGSGSPGAGSSSSAPAGSGSGLLAPVLAPLAPVVDTTVGTVTGTVGAITGTAPKPVAGEAPAPSGDGGATTVPQVGETVGVAPSDGPVTVRLPTGEVVPLGSAVVVPVGSIIDATKATVRLVSVRDADGTMQTGVFTGGRFEVRQVAGPKPITELVLRGGEFGRCAQRRDTAADPRLRASAGRLAKRLRPTARAAGSPVVRKLWGTDRSGRFRTRGRNAVATVRGTTWLTEDRCDGTRVAVEEGSVSVWPTAGGPSELVRAGDALLTPSD